MKRYLLALLVAVMAVVMLVGAVAALTSLPSTNDYNRNNNYAYFDESDQDFGEVTLDFFTPNPWNSCFEYRADGDTKQVISENHPINAYYPEFPDDYDLYPYFCLNSGNPTETLTVEANGYVEIRLAFGSENSEWFDWTRVDVDYNKDSCKDGGWEALGYSNQGECIQDANT